MNACNVHYSNGTKEPTETYFGYVRSYKDALLIIEATRSNRLDLVLSRLNPMEREKIRSGSVFVWEEHLCGIQRWTDGKQWSASRLDEGFLVYRELGPTTFSNNKNGNSRSTSPRFHPSLARRSGFEVLPEGLMKRSISVDTTDNKRFHLTNYYYAADIAKLPEPNADPMLRGAALPHGYYLHEHPASTPRKPSPQQQTTVSHPPNFTPQVLSQESTLATPPTPPTNYSPISSSVQSTVGFNSDSFQETLYRFQNIALPSFRASPYQGEDMRQLSLLNIHYTI